MIWVRCDSSVSASACAVSRDSRAALRAWSRASASGAALGIQRLARVFQFGHAQTASSWSVRASRACSRLLSRVSASCASSASIFSMRPRAESSRPCWLCSWPASSETLRCARYNVRCASSRCCSAASRRSRKLRQQRSSSRSRVCRVSISRAQRLDLALAQQRALLGRAGAQHAHPAGAEALAVAGDDRFALAQHRQHRARFAQVFGGVQLGQQAADRDRSLHLRSQRRRRELDRIVVRIAPGSGGLRRVRRAHRPALPGLRPARLRSTARARLRRRFPSRLRPVSVSPTRAAESRPRALQPAQRRALLLAQRGVLQGFQRRQAAARGLRLLAHLGQLGLRAALLVLQLAERAACASPAPR